MFERGSGCESPVAACAACIDKPITTIKQARYAARFPISFGIAMFPP
jgi:hypothetical protein